MAENLNVIYGESTDLNDFFEEYFNQGWDEKKELRKAKRADYATKLGLPNEPGSFSSMMFGTRINQSVNAVRKAHWAKCQKSLRNQLISNSLSAIGLPDNGIDNRKLERIPSEFWIVGEPDFEANSASDGVKSFVHVRTVSDRFERTWNATERIVEAILHEKKLHEANTGSSWWLVTRKDRISNCRAFIKNTHGINTLKTHGYSAKNFDKQFTIIRTETMG